MRAHDVDRLLRGHGITPDVLGRRKSGSPPPFETGVEYEMSMSLTNSGVNVHTIEERARNLADRRERESLEALQVTDWDETPIVDLRWTEPRPDVATGPSEYSVPAGELHVERHESPAPPLSEMAADGVRSSIQRVTRLLWKKIQREYEFGENE